MREPSDARRHPSEARRVARRALRGRHRARAEERLSRSRPALHRYALDSRDETGLITPGEGPLLVRSRADAEADKNLEGSVDSFDVDWSTESLLIVREHEREELHRYVQKGGELVVLASRAVPCLAVADRESFTQTEELRVYRVPNSVTSSRRDVVDQRYRVVSPSAKGCVRGEAPAAFGGGNPSVVRGPDGVRLYFGGFSAMTGNVFHGVSRDGITFTPNGWDEAHRSKFEGRGSYADVYEPFVEHLGDTWRMTATVFDVAYDTAGGKPPVPTNTTGMVEMTSPDGIMWSPSRDPPGDEPGRDIADCTEPHHRRR